MTLIKVKPGFSKTKIGFNNSAKPLGERQDLHLLLIDAKATNDSHILKMFESIPSDKELAEMKAKSFLPPAIKNSNPGADSGGKPDEVN